MLRFLKQNHSSHSPEKLQIFRCSFYQWKKTSWNLKDTNINSETVVVTLKKQNTKKKKPRKTTEHNRTPTSPKNPPNLNLELKLNDSVIQLLHIELVIHLCWSTAYGWLSPCMQGHKIQKKTAQNYFWSFNSEVKTRIHVAPKRTKINQRLISERNAHACTFRHYTGLIILKIGHF